MDNSEIDLFQPGLLQFWHRHRDVVACLADCSNSIRTDLGAAGWVSVNLVLGIMKWPHEREDTSFTKLARLERDGGYSLDSGVGRAIQILDTYLPWSWREYMFDLGY